VPRYILNFELVDVAGNGNYWSTMEITTELPKNEKMQLRQDRQMRRQ
jgi:hypothetical protein